MDSEFGIQWLWSIIFILFITILYFIILEEYMIYKKNYIFFLSSRHLTFLQCSIRYIKKERNIRLNWTWVTRQTDKLTSHILRHWLPFLFLKFGFLRVSTEYYGSTSHSQIRRKGATKPASLQPISSLQDFIIHQQF